MPGPNGFRSCLDVCSIFKGFSEVHVLYNIYIIYIYSIYTVSIYIYKLIYNIYAHIHT